METMTTTHIQTFEHEVPYIQLSNNTRVTFEHDAHALEPDGDFQGMLSYDGMPYGGGSWDEHYAFREGVVPAMEWAAKYVRDLVDYHGFDVDILNRAARIMAGEFDVITWRAYSVPSTTHRGVVRHLVVFSEWDHTLSDIAEWLAWADGETYELALHVRDDDGCWVRRNIGFSPVLYADIYGMSDEQIEFYVRALLEGYGLDIG